MPDLVPILVFMDREKTRSLQARAHLVRKREGIEQGLGGDA
jgi:hypothetical protein